MPSEGGFYTSLAVAAALPDPVHGVDLYGVRSSNKERILLLFLLVASCQSEVDVKVTGNPIARRRAHASATMTLRPNDATGSSIRLGSARHNHRRLEQDSLRWLWDYCLAEATQSRRGRAGPIQPNHGVPAFSNATTPRNPNECSAQFCLANSPTLSGKSPAVCPSKPVSSDSPQESSSF